MAMNNNNTENETPKQLLINEHFAGMSKDLKHEQYKPPLAALIEMLQSVHKLTYDFTTMFHTEEWEQFCCCCFDTGGNCVREDPDDRVYYDGNQVGEYYCEECNSFFDELHQEDANGVSVANGSSISIRLNLKTDFLRAADEKKLTCVRENAWRTVQVMTAQMRIDLKEILGESYEYKQSLGDFDKNFEVFQAELEQLEQLIEVHEN